MRLKGESRESEGIENSDVAGKPDVAGKLDVTGDSDVAGKSDVKGRIVRESRMSRSGQCGNRRRDQSPQATRKTKREHKGGTQKAHREKSGCSRNSRTHTGHSTELGAESTCFVCMLKHCISMLLKFIDVLSIVYCLIVHVKLQNTVHCPLSIVHCSKPPP